MAKLKSRKALVILLNWAVQEGRTMEEAEAKIAEIKSGREREALDFEKNRSLFALLNQQAFDLVIPVAEWLITDEPLPAPIS